MFIRSVERGIWVVALLEKNLWMRSDRVGTPAQIPRSALGMTEPLAARNPLSFSWKKRSDEDLLSPISYLLSPSCRHDLTLNRRTSSSRLRTASASIFTDSRL